jgi:serine/threonine protein kinase
LASDQYALGVVVYEWVSGMKPFNGSYIEIVTQHLSTPPPPLNEQALAIPHAVQQVVSRALAKDPHQRFPRVQDFADALEQAYQTQQRPIVVTPPAATYQARGASTATQFDQPGRPVHTVYAPYAAVGTEAPSFAPPPAKKVGRGLKRGLRIVAILFVLCGLLVCGLGYGVFHLFTAPQASTSTAGATALASDFVQAVSNRNYDQAYNDLGPQITKQTSRSQFIQNAQCEDSSYGAVTGYRNASRTSQGNSLSYVYLVTRGKLSQPYHLHLTLQQNSSGNWQVTDYNSDLSPPACH